MSPALSRFFAKHPEIECPNCDGEGEYCVGRGDRDWMEECVECGGRGRVEAGAPDDDTYTEVTIASIALDPAEFAVGDWEVPV